MSMISELLQDLKWLRERAADNNKGATYTLNVQAIDDAIDVIQTQGAKLAAYSSEKSLQYFNHGWIPCADRLPQVDKNGESEYLLVKTNQTFDKGGLQISYYREEKGNWDCEHDGVKVIEWTYLPDFS